MRGFDTAHSRYRRLDGEDRFVVDDSRVNHDPQHPIRRGDVLFLTGQFMGDDETSLSAPERAVMVGPRPSNDGVARTCLHCATGRVRAHAGRGRYDRAGPDAKRQRSAVCS